MKQRINKAIRTNGQEYKMTIILPKAYIASANIATDTNIMQAEKSTSKKNFIVSNIQRQQLQQFDFLQQDNAYYSQDSIYHHHL